MRNALLVFFLLNTAIVFAQSPSVNWAVQTGMYPSGSPDDFVRDIHVNDGGVYQYGQVNGPGWGSSMVYRKYKHSGGLQWSHMIHKNGSIGAVDSKNMVVDDSGYVYLAYHHYCEFFLETTPLQPLVMKQATSLKFKATMSFGTSPSLFKRCKKIISFNTTRMDTSTS